MCFVLFVYYVRIHPEKLQFSLIINSSAFYHNGYSI